MTKPSYFPKYINDLQGILCRYISIQTGGKCGDSLECETCICNCKSMKEFEKVIKSMEVKINLKQS